MEMGKVVGEVVEVDRSLKELVRPLVQGLLEVGQDRPGRLDDTPVAGPESHSRTRMRLLMNLMSRKAKVMVYGSLLAVLVDVQVVEVSGNSGIMV